MRSPLLLLLTLLLSATAAAQIQRGDHLIRLNGSGGGMPPASSLGSLSGNHGPAPVEGRYQSFGFGLGATYGYALRDRLVVGAGVGAGIGWREGFAPYGDGFTFSYSLDPFVRYYLINRPRLGGFAEVSSNSGNYDGDFDSFSALSLTAGLQVPLSENVLLTPTLNYNIRDEQANNVLIGAGLEVRLNRSNDGEAPEGGFGRGAITLGTQRAALSLRDRSLNAQTNVGAQYYLTDRLAAGAQLGLSFYRVGYEEFPRREKDSDSGVGASAGASLRYYLADPRRLSWYVEGGAGVDYSAGTSHQWEYDNNGLLDELVQVRRRSVGGEFFAGGGAQYMLRDRLALEAGPQLSYHTEGDRLSYGLLLGFRVGL